MPERTRSTASSEPSPRQPQPWHRLSVRIAIALTILGAGMWIYALATAPAKDAAGANQRTGDSALASGFAANDGTSTSSSSSKTVTRPIDAAAPAVLRLGISLLAGFALGFLMRSFLRWSILIVGVIAVAIFFLKRSGMIDLPWDSIEGDVREGASWLKSQVGGIKDVLAGYLPSSGAAVLGIIFGMRR